MVEGYSVGDSKQTNGWLILISRYVVLALRVLVSGFIPHGMQELRNTLYLGKFTD